VWAAAARAFGAREPDARVRNPDWLAGKLIGPEERALLSDHPLIAALDQPYEQALANLEAMSPARLLIPRTRFIDDRMQAALREGVEQIVILGAGYDSRAYRFAEQLANARVIEVDRPDTQRLKVGRMRDVFGKLPPCVTYAPIDLANEGLGSGLAQAGYAPHQRTFFIWEGVTFYLPADSVRGTLGWISANSAAGSEVVFDYTYDSSIQMIKSINLDTVPGFVRQAILRFRSLTAGEPWIFGLPDQQEKEFLNGLGFEPQQIMGINSREAVERYLTREDGSIFGSMPASDRQWYSILNASVVPRA
jgi:methyltransferase (TIGR00027 family)